MMKPVNLNTSLLFKVKNVNTLDEFIKDVKDGDITTSLNISSCSISMTTRVNNTLHTIEPNDTEVDFVMSNIIWNKHFHLNDRISWIQLENNRRLTSIQKFIDQYTDPIFICEFGDIQVFTYNGNIPEGVMYKTPLYLKSSPDSYNSAMMYSKHNPDLLNYVLTHVNSIDECYSMFRFINKHSFITNDWDLLATMVRDDDFMVLPIKSFEFKFNKKIHIIGKHATIHLPMTIFAIPTIKLSILDTYIHTVIGFNPKILYKVIIEYDSNFKLKYPDYSEVIVIFKPYNSTVDNPFTNKMINAYHKFSNDMQFDDCWIYEY